MKTDLGHRPTRWVWLGPDERGGYPSGPKRVSELKPPPRTAGIGATQRSGESDEANASSPAPPRATSRS